MPYAYTVDALFHPATQPVFVGVAAQPRFRPDARGFDLANAWWLANAAHLAYYDADGVERELGRVGLKLVEFFDAGSTQGFLAAGDAFAILAFRGTKAEDREDLRADANFFLTPFGAQPPTAAGPGAWAGMSDLVDALSGQGTRVHLGFRDALDQVWVRVDAQLAELAARGVPVWNTGHSLGAALATLAAARRTPAALYTFGSPRVGNEAFTGLLARGAVQRIVNCCDIVATVPPEVFGYRHAGEQRFLTPRAHVRTDPPPWRIFIDQVYGVIGFWSRRPFFRRDTVKVRFLADHAIVNYTLALERALRRGTTGEPANPNSQSPT